MPTKLFDDTYTVSEFADDELIAAGKTLVAGSKVMTWLSVKNLLRKSLVDADGDTWVTVEETTDADTIVAQANQTGTGIIQTWKNTTGSLCASIAADKSISTQSLHLADGSYTGAYPRIYHGSATGAGYILFPGYGGSTQYIFNLDNDYGSIILKNNASGSTSRVALFNSATHLGMSGRATSAVDAKIAYIENNHLIKLGDRDNNGLEVEDTVIESAAGHASLTSGRDIYIHPGAGYVAGTNDGNVLICDDTSGLVGIGTGTPAEKLDVVGNIQIDTGSSYKVNSIQVVTDQQPAVADATDAASVILRLNELLARLRTHGLIAT